jgi:O-antigen/teichoic acid export membrane protein
MSKKGIVSGSIGYFITNLINRVFGFLFVVLVTRLIGTDGYGLVALGLTIRGLINNFGMFGLTFSSQKLLSGDFNNEKQNYLGAMSILNTGIAFLAFVVFYFGADYIAVNLFNKAEFIPVLKVISVSIIFSLPLSLSRSLLKAQKKVKLNFYTLVLESSFKVIALILVFVIEDKVMAITSAILFSTFISFALGLFIIFKESYYPKYENIAVNLKYIISIGSQFLIVGLGYYFASQTDRLMLGRMATSEALGMYAVAAALAQIIGTLHGSMVSIFMPTVSELHRKGNVKEIEKTYYFANIVVASINIVVFLMFMIFGKQILDILFDLSGTKIYIVFLLLSLKYLIGTFVGPTGALLNMTGNHRIEFYNTLFMITTNILLNYFLIKYYGLYGAVFATLIAAVTQNLIQLVEIYKIYNFLVLKSIHLYYFLSVFIITFVLFNFNIINLNFIYKGTYFVFVSFIIFIIFWFKNKVIGKDEVLKFIKLIKNHK